MTHGQNVVDDRDEHDQKVLPCFQAQLVELGCDEVEDQDDLLADLNHF